jgi:uncharacterized protein YjgD (DUF1641 family)
MAMALEDDTRIAETAPDVAVTRLVEATLATLTDDMISRLSQVASEGLTWLDELQRSRVQEAITILSQMLASGDLARLAGLARVLGAAEDALTDDLVTRLSALASSGLTVLDVLTPSVVERLAASLPAVLDLIEAARKTGLLQDAMAGLKGARERFAALPRPQGGVGGLWTILKDADNQRTIQALLFYGRHLLSPKG